MRVLYLPLMSPDIPQAGMRTAFRQAGAQLQVYDFAGLARGNRTSKEIASGFVKAAEKFQPDLVHMQLQYTSTISPATVRQVRGVVPKAIFTNWTGDIRTTIPSVFPKMSHAVDLSLVSSVGQLEKFRAACKSPVEYWQIGYDPSLYFPPPTIPKAFRWDAIFTASHFPTAGFPGVGQRRKTVVNLHGAFGKRFGLFGSGWSKKYKAIPVPQSKVNELYHQSRTVVSVNNFNEVSHYFSDRLLMCLGSGRPTICLAFPGWQSYFTEGHDILVARSPQEIPQKVRWVLRNKGKAEELGRRGGILARAEHTYLSRVRELFSLVGLS